MLLLFLHFKLLWPDIILDWQGDKRQKVDSEGYGVKGSNREVVFASFDMEFSEQ